MSFRDNKSTVLFRNNDEQIVISKEMVEQIYRYKEMEYLKEDAEKQLNDFIYGYQYTCNGEYIKKCEDSFYKKYNITAEAAFDHIENLAEEFKYNQDCNSPDNDTWQNLIENYFEDNKS